MDALAAFENWTMIEYNVRREQEIPFLIYLFSTLVDNITTSVLSLV